MRRPLIIPILLIVSLSLSIEVSVVYISESMDLGVVKRYEVPQGKEPLSFLFQMMASPPPGYRSYVPKDILRAGYLLSDALVIDLNGTSLSDLGFKEERLFLYQILISLFRTYDVNEIYILVDGKQRGYLMKYVDISLGFRRQDWLNWPLEVTRH